MQVTEFQIRRVLGAAKVLGASTVANLIECTRLDALIVRECVARLLNEGKVTITADRHVVPVSQRY